MSLSARRVSQLIVAIFWNADAERVRALWRVLLHGVTLVVLAIGLAIIVEGIGLSGGAVGGLSAFGSVMTAIVVAVGTWLCGRFLDRRSLPSFGLRLSPQWWADVGAGLGIGAIAMVGIFVVELQAGWLTIVGYKVGAGPGRNFWIALCDPALTFVMVAFYEELLSRGYHLRNLAEGLFGPRLGHGSALALATVLSAGVFGLLHAGNANATVISTINVGLAGCLLALGPLWTGELGLAIGLHLSWNFCQGNVFGFPVSGNPMSPRIVDVVQGGDPLITGGAFGPEAGLVGIVAMLICAGLTAAWVRLTRGEVRLQRRLALPDAQARERPGQA